ncbi:MAG: hypothetical protein HYX35_01005 [Proteobacteria bacterium]|nr:hypothetical protein [Pseudomonadota bacterium]
MLKKTRRLLTLFLFFTMGLVFLLQNNLFGMDHGDDDNDLKSLPITRPEDMSREELLALVRAQHQQLETTQSIFHEMSPAEQEAKRILSTPIPESAFYLIEALALVQKKRAAGITTFSLDEALKEEAENQTFPRSLTIREVLKDKTVPEDTASKLFRGVLVSIAEEGSLNIGQFQHFTSIPSMERGVLFYLAHRYHILKVVYPEHGLIDHLISEYLTLRPVGRFIWKFGKAHKFSMF